MPKKKMTRPPLAARRPTRPRHVKKREPQSRPKTATKSQTKSATILPSVPLTDSLAYAGSRIRDIPNFPKPGIIFKDITPLLADPRAFHIVLDALAERFIGEHIDAIVGVEARGFIFGGALAARLNASFVPARKPGKLPGAVDSVQYDTEYSTAELQMHQDSIIEDSRVVIVDDLLATGGTAKASAELVRHQGGHVIAYAFVVELAFLGGREHLLPVRVESVIRY